MFGLIPTALFATAALTQIEDVGIPFSGNLDVAPGRANRFQARAGTDFGILKFNCKGGESACNNACYYINCHAPANNIKDADKIVYTGPKSKDNDRNRRESGCQARHPPKGAHQKRQNHKPHKPKKPTKPHKPTKPTKPNKPKKLGSTTSVCRAFPYSQRFIPSDKHSEASSWQCDEWPPASSQQQPFGSSGRIANSLRCMPSHENEALGRQMASFYQGHGTWPGRKTAGKMARNDYARVEFDISQADGSKVSFCIKHVDGLHCDNDVYQFGLTKKRQKYGQISVPIEPNDSDQDNLYALQDTRFKRIFQCSIKLTREGDNHFKSIELGDGEGTKHEAPDCDIPGATGHCTLEGLPKELKLFKKGPLGSKLKFEYAPGEEQTNFNWYAWDTDSEGKGKGPTADKFYCKKGKSGNEEDIECWFPCYENADGR
ncbi:deoxyribonuclease NucA/NucB domain-containing protein [Hirsutella rhossiliensis]|uniref:Deoxyribonuclease nucA/NucB domain-containing protein n=1 Tax=Hirsutella rhossiliensis TaxID=111463 RepID=A0A9P8SLJ1_9HYPO|nr:deoxyribonuclease nucA/NucB domain-containing protein [Hirsutella rhossiliensis]KAH0966319.1 deoxyribonuclease nucA/NucB domain-containing protein [Hirsutella rhossiliensis]